MRGVAVAGLVAALAILAPDETLLALGTASAVAAFVLMAKIHAGRPGRSLPRDAAGRAEET